MARLFHVVLFVIPRLLLLSLAEAGKVYHRRCPPFKCGSLGQLRFPFTNGTATRNCGLLKVDNCGDRPKMRLGNNESWFYIINISQDDTIMLSDQLKFKETFDNCSSAYLNLTLPISPLYFLEMPDNQNYSSIIHPNQSSHAPSPPPFCLSSHFRVNKTQNSIHFLNLYTGFFSLRVNVSRECRKCYYREQGRCQIDNKGKFHCSGTGNGKARLRLVLGLGGGSTLLVVVVSICIIWHCKKQRYTSPSFNERYTSSDPSSKSELEVGSAYFGVPIFSYRELSEATNNFSHEKELGDGGFGTVYYAKLRDGREVAVKRLYEHNYKRVEQFMNEVEILTRLRHRNLVQLYGCTSRHSQQGLLLVYEYIPNGTLADHLHGDRAKPGSLTWPTRMNIAIETASALAYLHACEIIHRDVKTNNILLDNNFCVKVADFGLSRLIPTNVTHVSTAPQGSPGYVDPEYHQYYQLTDKSDVYSFGVVLIELLSSMPAVDISRHRHEINLANLAVNRIQKRAIDELIDPSLGYQSDEEVKRMATSVAELAFLCLQHNKEMRPSMEVVLEELKRIESGESLKWENLNEKHADSEALESMRPPASPPDWDERALLKPFRVPSSPISVTAKWVSNNTTPDVSC